MDFKRTTDDIISYDRIDKEIFYNWINWYFTEYDNGNNRLMYNIGTRNEVAKNEFFWQFLREGFQEFCDFLKDEYDLGFPNASERLNYKDEYERRFAEENPTAFKKCQDFLNNKDLIPIDYNMLIEEVDDAEISDSYKPRDLEVWMKAFRLKPGSKTWKSVVDFFEDGGNDEWTLSEIEDDWGDFFEMRDKYKGNKKVLTVEVSPRGCNSMSVIFDIPAFNKIIGKIHP